MTVAPADERLFLIDASIYIFKHYFSLPPNWRAENGRPTEAVCGYANWLLGLLADQRPQRVVACFDESLGSCFRNAIYPGYKHSRVLPDDDLAFQLLACREFTAALGIRCAFSERYEADDFIGSYGAMARRRGQPCAIVSRDRDLTQLLLDDNFCLWDYPAQAPTYAADVRAKLGVAPAQVADFLALTGDPGDDIPGVPGIGVKTAAALLAHFPTWPALRDNLDAVAALPIRGARGAADALRAHAAQVDMARRLTAIACDIPGLRWAATKRRRARLDEVQRLSQALGIDRAVRAKLARWRAVASP